MGGAVVRRLRRNRPWTPQATQPGGDPLSPTHDAAYGPTSPVGGPVTQADPYAVGRRSSTLLTLLFVLIVAGGVVSFIPLPYVVLQPGPVTNTLGELDGKPIIQVKGATAYPAKGTLDFTTVRVVGGPGVRVNAFDLAEAALRKDYEIFPREQIYPEATTREQIQQENAAEMVDSQEVAAAVALRETGRTVPEKVVVSQVPEGSPATGVLKAGDQFVSVAGKPADDASAVQGAVRATKAGTPVSVVVRRDGKEQTLSVPTRDNDGTTIIGVLLGRDYELPVDVTITAGGVGGPSAGTMFSLAVYDVLTPGDLTGGKQIAGTGTMSPDETVGPIGGIRQKLSGAKDGGAEWFLAPEDNCGEVVGHVPDGLRVVRVGTFTEALDAVEAIAAGKGNDLPSCASSP
ncbi:PDZ domain-containing protein [Knoellia remsis]|uniref:endopeptidase La n=1 Tax=Knoellia remsis TaxID=407159 RepID=A0A2T0UYF7_9MICO|nr:PDZ domain-containing protein [Knoellia remsis]